MREMKPNVPSLDEIGQKLVAPSKSPLSEAIRTEILRLAQEGDPKAGGTLTAEHCSRIGRVIKAGRDLILTERATGLSDLVRGLKAYNGVSFANAYTGENVTDDVGGDAISGGSPVSFNNENFGMTAIRELVGMARGFHDSPEKLVAALAVARENKLDDVAAALSKKLGLEEPSLISEADTHTPGWRAPDELMRTSIPQMVQIESQTSEGRDEL